MSQNFYGINLQLTGKNDRMYNDKKRGKTRYIRGDLSTKDTPLNTSHIASFIMNVVPLTNVLCGISEDPSELFSSRHNYTTQSV